MAVTKDLGAVTAYAHAVEGGYTGTLAEFETLMASYATVAQQAAASASDAEAFGAGTRSGVPVSSGDDAYENNAVYYAGLAEDAKDDAEAAAASLVIEDEFDEDSTNALENGVITKALETKAEIDGAYESMTVGNAEQLVSTVFVNDEEPYNFRTAGGSADIGDREYDTIVGGTVAWNQKVSDASFLTGASEAGVTRTKNNDGTLTISGQATAVFRITDGLSTATKGHKWFVADANRKVSLYTGTISEGLASAENGGIIYQNNANSLFLYCRESGTDFGNGVIIKPIAIDLTQMFGSTIADYIYSLETANEGAGVAFFRKLFPKPYYAYNAGELMSVQAASHDTVGFNAWDEEWELGWIHTDGSNRPASDIIRSKNYIPVIPNTKYYFNVPDSTDIIYFDSDKTAIGNIDKNNQGDTSATSRIRTTHDNCHYIRFWTRNQSTYNHDICINLSWDGERDGEYEEYVKHSYALDSDLVLRGIPKLDASNNLYYDGDIYHADGTVDRRATEYTITGNEGWQYYSTDDYFYCNPALGAIQSGDSNPTTAIFVGYKQNVRMTGASGGADMSFTLNTESHANNNFYVRNTSFNGDLNAFKSYITGKKIVFLLATPTTETADPYTNPQIVNDFGTEEYVDYAVSQGDRDVSFPVGHYTEYMANLKAKLEMSPNSPEGAGDYLVRQTNGENEYVTLASNATIQDIIARLEALEGGGE